MAPPNHFATTLPADIRWMQAATGVLWRLGVLAIVAAAVLAATRSSWWDVQGLRIDGDTTHLRTEDVREQVLPRLAGNVLSADLERVRAAFESLPWVQQASVRRVWPDALAVTLREHQLAARWESDEPQKLVDREGRIFDAEPGPDDEALLDRLPVLEGPVGNAPRLLAAYRSLDPVFQQADRSIARLSLSQYGVWRARLDDDAVVVLGRGEEAELRQRAQAFAATLPGVIAHYRSSLLYADLRQPGGYAVRLRGVATMSAASAAVVAQAASAAAARSAAPRNPAPAAAARPTGTAAAARPNPPAASR